MPWYVRLSRDPWFGSAAIGMAAFFVLALVNDATAMIIPFVVRWAAMIAVTLGTRAAIYYFDAKL